VAGVLSVSVRELLAAQVAKLFGESADIVRNVQTVDGAGGFTDTWGAIATEACSFYGDRTVQENVATGLTFAGGRYTAVFADTSVVRRGDRLLINTRTYQVLAVTRGSNAVTLQASCLEVPS